nr:MAG TPA: hypothetical protein [Bacteriophage sp.]
MPTFALNLFTNSLQKLWAPSHSRLSSLITGRLTARRLSG